VTKIVKSILLRQKAKRKSSKNCRESAAPLKK